MLSDKDHSHKALLHRCRHLTHFDEESVLKQQSLMYHYDKHIDPDSKERVSAEIYAMAGSILATYADRSQFSPRLNSHSITLPEPKLIYTDSISHKSKYHIGDLVVIIKNDIDPSQQEFTPFVSFCKLGANKLNHHDIKGVLEAARNDESFANYFHGGTIPFKELQSLEAIL